MISNEYELNYYFFNIIKLIKKISIFIKNGNYFLSIFINLVNINCNYSK